MRQLFHSLARRGVMLKALIIVATVAAIAIAGGAPWAFNP